MSRVNQKMGIAQVEPLLVDVKTLARMLSTSVRSVWRMNSGGKVPLSVRVGRSVRWNVATIREWIELGCPDRATFEARRRAVDGGPNSGR